jgi:hypothetical protein
MPRILIESLAFSKKSLAEIAVLPQWLVRLCLLMTSTERAGFCCFAAGNFTKKKLAVKRFQNVRKGQLIPPTLYAIYSYDAI